MAFTSQSLRYISTTLAAYIGETVTLLSRGADCFAVGWSPGFWWRIFFLRDFSALHTEQRIHVSLPVPHDTAQFAPPLIPGTENLSKRNGLACQFRANRSAQEPLIVEDADLGHVTRIESQRRIVELDSVRAVEG